MVNENWNSGLRLIRDILESAYTVRFASEVTILKPLLYSVYTSNTQFMCTSLLSRPFSLKPMKTIYLIVIFFSDDCKFIFQNRVIKIFDEINTGKMGNVHVY